MLKVFVLAFLVSLLRADQVTQLRITKLLLSGGPVSDAETMNGFSSSDFKWLELQNTGSTTLDVGGAKLTSGVKYTFPAGTQLAPGSRLVLCESVPAFTWRYPSVVAKKYSGKLQGGDNLTLVSSTSALIQSFTIQDWWPEASEYAHPLVIKDASLGVSSWSFSSSWYVGIQYGVPGGTDIGTGAISYSNLNVLVTADFALTLSLSAANAGVTVTSIYYTTDRTLPTTSSPVYSSAISISGVSVQVRAFAKLSNGLFTPYFSRTYVRAGSTLPNWQMMDLPAVIVETFGDTNIMSTSKIDVKCYLVILEPPVGVVNPLLINNYISWHGMAIMSVHGSSSSGFPKKSYSVDFYDSAGGNLNMQPFGLPKESDWILYGPYEYDRILIRNVLVYKLWREFFGYYGPRTKFVEVIMNQAGTVDSSDYFGVYVWIEKLKRDSKRIDITSLETWDNAGNNVTGGYILKIDRGDINLGGADTFSAGGQTFVYDSPSYSVITQQQKSYLSLWWNNFSTTLNAATAAQVHPEYMNLLNINQTIDYHLINYWTKNVDGLRLSTVLYKDRGGPFTWSPVWDYDRTLGCDSDSRCPGASDAISYYFDNSQAAFWNQFFNNAQFVRRYAQRWWYWRNKGFNYTTVAAIVANISSEIKATYPRNYVRWPAVAPSANYNDAYNRMLTWISQRFDYMDSLTCYSQVFACKDNDYCTDEVCNMRDGSCLNVLNDCPWPTCRYTSSDNQACDDNNACTINDKCYQGICKGSPRDCSDAFSCTSETCNIVTGCITTPNNSLCNDGISCTRDSCTIASGCVYTPDDTLCDDGVACTNNICDVTSGCKFVPDDTKCDDGVACTTNTCSQVGCTYSPDNTLCNDGVSCTIDTCTTPNGCNHQASDALCDDSIECTSEVCDVTQGCQFTLHDDLCDDGIICTTNKCLQAGCVFSPDVSLCVPPPTIGLDPSCLTKSCVIAQKSCTYQQKQGCNKQPPVPVSVNTTVPVIPMLICIESSNGKIFHLGYNNSGRPKTLPIGPTNSFSPDPQDRGQPTLFQSGFQGSYPFYTIQVTASSNLKWTLDGKSLSLNINAHLPCPTVSSVFISVTQKQTASLQLDRISSVVAETLNITATDVLVERVAIYNGQTTYSISFINQPSSILFRYCDKFPALNVSISNVTSGVVTASGCPDYLSISSSTADGINLLWWHYVVIGVGGALLIAVIAVGIYCAKSSTSEIV